MAKRKPTIQEVARLAKVGIGTVSRVLNNHPSVRAETRARVEWAIEELAYTPNPHARRIAGGRSYTISVLLPVLATDFYNRLIEGIEETLAPQRYDLALFPLLSRSRLERYLDGRLLAYQADGLLVASCDLTELFAQHRLPTERPVVLVDTWSPVYDSVYCDNSLGGALAGRYLARFPGPITAIVIEEEIDRLLGHTVFSERLAGFQGALAELGRPFGPEFLYVTHLSVEGGQLGLQRFLEHFGTPLNIFAGADLIARGVVEEARRQGLVVGRDVRVLGYDDHPWAQELQLSSLRQPIEEMGAQATRLLLERIRGHAGPPRRIRFEPELVIRGSTEG